MWGSRKSSTRVAGPTTLVSEETTVVGEVRFSGCLDIEGLVQGNVVAEPGADALVRVVGRGRVEGEIRAPLVVINGEVEGDVHSSRQLELAPRGRVNGNVYYASVEMSAGAEVNGSLTHVEPAEADEADEATGPGV